jgi:hypothetical protein
MLVGESWGVAFFEKAWTSTVGVAAQFLEKSIVNIA